MWTGKFITIEGRDGIGKTTLVKNLFNKLKEQDIPVEIVSFPDRKSHTGALIDECLRNKKKIHPAALHMLFSANRIETALKLSKDRCILADRYTLSGYVYASIAQDENFAVALGNIERIINIPIPDLTIILEGKQFEEGAELYETDEFQNAASEKYKNFSYTNKNVILVNVNGMDQRKVLETVYNLCLQKF